MDKIKLEQIKLELRGALRLLNNSKLDTILLKSTITKINQALWKTQLLRKEVLRDEEKIKTYSA